MTLDELYKQWGTWTSVANELKIAQSVVTYWRKRGSIPFTAQLLIQNKTDNLLQARREDDAGTGNL